MSAEVSSPLVGITQRPNPVVVYAHSGGGNDRSSTLLGEPVTGQRLHAQRCTLDANVHLARPEADAVAKYLRDYQSSCLVDGCSHTISLPLCVT